VSPLGRPADWPALEASRPTMVSLLLLLWLLSGCERCHCGQVSFARKMLVRTKTRTQTRQNGSQMEAWTREQNATIARKQKMSFLFLSLSLSRSSFS